MTGFARNPRGVTVEHPRLRIAAGDVTVASTVHAATRDTDAVVWAIGGHDRVRDPRRRSLGVCSVGTAHVVDAMRTSGVRRLICQSSWGVADSLARVPFLQRRVIFPMLLADELADKGEQETRIRHSGLDWRSCARRD